MFIDNAVYWTEEMDIDMQYLFSSNENLKWLR